jgi:hypothetical protein
VLTNTFVGKKLLGHGVGSITGTLSELCSARAECAGGGAGGWAAGCLDTEARCSSMLSSMALTVSQLFLSAEPRMHGLYKADSSSGAADFRCSGCYHLFGVDLIADAEGRFHVIEVCSSLVHPAASLLAHTLGAWPPERRCCLSGALVASDARISCAFRACSR